MVCNRPNLRCVLTIFNLMTMVTGALLLIVAVFVHAKGREVKEIVQGYTSVPSWALFTVGCLVFLLAFFGCCGIIKDSKLMLIIYGAILLIVLIFNVAFIIVLFVHKDKVEEALEKKLTENFNDYAKFQKMIDAIQHRHKCCGADGPDSWKTELPSSCCPKNSPKCSKDIAYQDGCIQLATDIVTSDLRNLAIVAIVQGICTALAVICSFCLAYKITQYVRGYIEGDNSV